MKQLSFFILTCFLILCIACSSESAQKEKASSILPLHQEYADNLCACLSAKQITSDFEVLSRKYEECALEFVEKEKSRLDEFVNSFGIEDTPQAQYDKEHSMGRLIARAGNKVMIQVCDPYREELIKFKETTLFELNISEAKVDTVIAEFEEIIPNAADPNMRAQLFALLGLFYEMKKDNKTAIEYYRKGSELKAPNSYMADIFGELLNYTHKEI